MVISEEFVKSHKLYKLLREQMAVADARHSREAKELAEELAREEAEAKQARDSNHTKKIELWELRTQFIELKAVFEEEEQ